jgi:hypothetical protein
LAIIVISDIKTFAGESTHMSQMVAQPAHLFVLIYASGVSTCEQLLLHASHSNVGINSHKIRELRDGGSDRLLEVSFGSKGRPLKQRS